MGFVFGVCCNSNSVDTMELVQKKKQQPFCTIDCLMLVAAMKTPYRHQDRINIIGTTKLIVFWREHTEHRELSDRPFNRTHIPLNNSNACHAIQFTLSCRCLFFHSMQIILLCTMHRAIFTFCFIISFSNRNSFQTFNGYPSWLCIVSIASVWYRRWTFHNFRWTISQPDINLWRSEPRAFNCVFCFSIFGKKAWRIWGNFGKTTRYQHRMFVHSFAFLNNDLCQWSVCSSPKKI